MSDIGIKKKIDNLGRVCIPKEMRVLFNLEGEVELVLRKEGIVIRKPGNFENESKTDNFLIN